MMRTPCDLSTLKAQLSTLNSRLPPDVHPRLDAVPSPLRHRAAALGQYSADAHAELAFADLQPCRAAPAHAAGASRLLRERRRGAFRSPAGGASGARVRRRSAEWRG